MEHEFSARIGAHPKDSELSIDGNNFPYMRGFRIISDLDDDGPSRVEVKLLAVKPFEVSGSGEITVDAKVVSEPIARQVFESLKRIFEP